MPKVLLINPQFNVQKEKYDSSISVGLLCVASYLAERGADVRIVDCARQTDFMSKLDQALEGVGYAGLSVMTTQVPSAIELSCYIKSKNPEIKIIWGGLHPTFFPEQAMAASYVDYVVQGEGEKTLWELLQSLEDGKIEKLKYVKGLVSKDPLNSSKIYIGERRELMSMEEVPLPYWDLMPFEILERLTLVPTHTSRGCPHRCTFCVNAITKNYWRGRAPEKVLEDLAVIKTKPYFRGKKVRFWDENFFVDLSRAGDIAEGMIKNNFVMPWESTIRADYCRRPELTDEFLKKIRESGCYLFSFGAESGSPRILKKINKDIAPEDILNSAKRTLKAGIIPQYSFMCGLPGETVQDMMLTVDLIDGLMKLSPNIQILGPQAFRPYPGSPLYNECIASGWRAPTSLNEWVNTIRSELSYLAPSSFPWVDNPNLVESLEVYARFGAQPLKSALASTITKNKILKFFFALICKLRWKFKFFRWPIEIKLAKKYITSATSN